MKIGMILECTLSGPDVAVYTYVANQLCPQLVIEKPITKGDKKTLINEAALEAQTLLETGCYRVFIIWDKIPRWNIPGNCITDREALLASLQHLKVDHNKVIMCCIDEMMESWLIADGRGMDAWLEWITKGKRKLPKFGDHKNKQTQNAPKQRIQNYLDEHYSLWTYSDYENNLDIVKRLPDLERVASYNPSFRYFKEHIEELCP
jgi:hypothetical protein